MREHILNSLPERVGLQWHVLLPFILLHQCPDTPVGVFNLLIHAAISGDNNHRMREVPPDRSRNSSCLQEGG